MGIENGDKISDLNPLWPLGTDPVSQGDDQIRLIKNVMVNDALGKSEGGTISADLTVDGDLTVDNVTADSVTADNITADNVTVNNNLTALSGGLGGTFEPVLTAKQTRSSKSLEQNIITSATDAIGVWSGFQFEVSKGDATAGTDLIASINRNGLQVEGINVSNGITFGAGTDALDDYETGSFPPNIGFNNNTSGITFQSTPEGIYTKVGRKVTVIISFALANKGNNSGNFTCSLPFTSISDGQGSGAMGYNYNWVDGDKAKGFTFQVHSGVLYMMSANNGSFATNVEFNNDTFVSGITVTYFTSE